MNVIKATLEGLEQLNRDLEIFRLRHMPAAAATEGQENAHQ